MNRDGIDFGTAPVPVLFRKLFIPTLLGMLSISAVATVDGIFVGHGVGSDGIAAVNICIPLLMFFTGIGLMAGAGCSVVSSIHLADGNVKAARINVTQALLFVTAVTLVPVVLIMCMPERTALLLGSSERLLPSVRDYLVWFVPSLVFQMWSSVSLFVIRLDGSPRYAMMCSVVPAVMNVLLDWLFIFPLGMGVAGAAAASTASVVTGGLMAVVYISFRARTLSFCRLKASRKSLMLTLRNIGYQCRIGFSAFLGECTLAVLMYAGNRVFMKYLSDDGVGAFGIACYYIPFVFMVGNAIAQSAQPIVSYNYASGALGRVTQASRVSFLTAVCCSLTVAFFFVFFPDALVSLFIPSGGPARDIAVRGFPYFACGFLFFVVNLAATGLLQSLEKALAASVFALLRGLVFLVPSFVLMPLLLGEKGIWLAMPLSELLTFLAIAVTYWFSIRKQYRLV